MSKLKRCPFCGENERLDILTDTCGKWTIECKRCGVTLSITVNTKEISVDEAQEMLIEKWNSRYSSWDLLMEILDQYYPADIFGGEDAMFKASENIGCAIVEKLREIDTLRKRRG